MGKDFLGALLAVGLCLAACGAPRAAEREPSSAQPGSGAAARDIAPEFLPALEALEREVREGHDVQARAILARLLARNPQGPALELARAFERVLDGRELVRGLRLRLEASEDPARAGRYRLELVLAQTGDQPLALRPGPALLVRRMLTVQADGGERRGSHERSVAVPAWVGIEPNEEKRLDLGLDTVPAAAGALAVRCSWELRFLAAEVQRGGRALPAKGLEAAPTSRVLLADFLSSEPVQPGELARYAREERVWRAPALERAVRMPPSAYGAALDELAAQARLLNLVSLAELVPALRWLAGEAAPVGGPEAWQRWLLARSQPPPEPAPALDMPTSRR